MIETYLGRWQIELFFKILKSGCGIEALYLQTKQKLLNALALYAIIAWRILYLTRIGRVGPDLPCTVVFSAAEWRAAYYMAYRTAPPATPITLREMLLLIGQFGGFFACKDHPMPGIKSTWIGLQRLQYFTAAYETFGPSIATRSKRPGRKT